jgi:hypothetical protein
MKTEVLIPNDAFDKAGDPTLAIWGILESLGYTLSYFPTPRLVRWSWAEVPDERLLRALNPMTLPKA